MPNTESEVIQTILKNGGKAKKKDIVKELGVSLGYLDIITRSLERRGLVKFSNNVYSLTLLGKKKLAGPIQKTKKIELEAKKKRGRPRGKWHPKESRLARRVEDPRFHEAKSGQKTEFKDNNEPKIKLTEQTEESKESPATTLLERRIDELKEGVAEAEKKIEEGVKNIEEKIEKELEKKIEATEEKIKPAGKKIEELPQIILQFGKFLSFVSKKIFNKCKKIKEKQLPKASLVFAKLRDFKARDKLTSLPIWITKRYKNFIKKRS